LLMSAVLAKIDIEPTGASFIFRIQSQPPGF